MSAFNKITLPEDFRPDLVAIARQVRQLPTDGATSVVVVDVSNVIKQIRYNVHRIRENILARFPYGTGGATTALVTLLEDISNRNKDALDGNMWGRATFHGEEEDHRNLYHQLIGSEKRPDEAPVLHSRCP
ncbi:hypothetical protein MPDQ_004864 [Monascus purpureus]|uniref:Uncharacterized protein n=1 Tax=Monascus purpureus TaxID=5098 RepID=A0A507R1X2_MONPU|nr:hypothetical protein MPDQ_004864 [Monascus purpureus]